MLLDFKIYSSTDSIPICNKVKFTNKYFSSNKKYYKTVYFTHSHKYIPVYNPKTKGYNKENDKRTFRSCSLSIPYSL